MKTKDGNRALKPVNRALSARQVEVLTLVSRGLNQREIASSLGVRYYTVGEHLKQTYRKLGVHNRAAAVTLALRQGLLNERTLDAGGKSLGIEKTANRFFRRHPALPPSLKTPPARFIAQQCPHCGQHLEGQIKP